VFTSRTGKDNIVIIVIAGVPGLGAAVPRAAGLILTTTIASAEAVIDDVSLVLLRGGNLLNLASELFYVRMDVLLKLREVILGEHAKKGVGPTTHGLSLLRQGLRRPAMGLAEGDPRGTEVMWLKATRTQVVPQED